MKKEGQKKKKEENFQRNKKEDLKNKLKDKDLLKVLLIEKMTLMKNSDNLMIRKKKISKMQSQNLLLKKELSLSMLYQEILQTMLDCKSKKYKDVVINYSKHLQFNLLQEKKKLILN